MCSYVENDLNSEAFSIFLYIFEWINNAFPVASSLMCNTVTEERGEVQPEASQSQFNKSYVMSSAYHKAGI